MRVCVGCGEENLDRARFCSACGVSLPEAKSGAREERKVVSVLFVDLVGFTARSERVDPEDVRALLVPYYARVRLEIERFGGTVEKFVGDAVMAVFGAPVVREDDAERAVRAGLRVLDAIEEMNEAGSASELVVRVGVNTGEALVAVGARPEVGEAMVAGDVVNTAARLQSVAPTGTLVVGEATFRAAEGAVVFEALAPVALKGKSGVVKLWRAVEARSRLGVGVERDVSSPFVGRREDLAVLTQAFERASRERAGQLVTVTGEPGVGKSRLVGELLSFVDDRPELVTWRQGRCLSYGEGLAFWALGEICKAHCGVLDSDSSGAVEEKLAEAVARVVRPGEEAWVRARLASLLGVGDAAEASVVSREEAFAGWRMFLEGIAEAGPLVLVFEDLHWADDGLLDFVEHLVEWAVDVPMLVVATGRPELFERRTAWGGGVRNAATIALSPLSVGETSELVSFLLARQVLSESDRQVLLERSGGNPLYAQQFVRALGERVEAQAELAVPESVQALIAARLDTLAHERKGLLHDAAVIGRVFWVGALARMGDRDIDEVEGQLRELARKELVRRVRTSSLAGESEYAFWHALVQDVAYGQIPRRARAEKHQAAAAWIEATHGGRVTARS